MPGFNEVFGAVTAAAVYFCAAMVFAFKLARMPRAVFWAGLAEFMMIIPLGYLFISGFENDRPFAYFLQTGLMISWLCMMLMADYIRQTDFRKTKWKVISFTVWFFAATAGMLGIAARAGGAWLAAAIVMFAAMVVLTFTQNSTMRRQ
ncbi:MAG: hypothetical protein JXB33_05165 [Clostridia bacterium]|nr:hypothetical protein [Clostridia bacterium]